MLVFCMGAKYDDKLMHTNIVLHGSVVKQWGLSPHHISSGPRPLLSGCRKIYNYCICAFS